MIKKLMFLAMTLGLAMALAPKAAAMQGVATSSVSVAGVQLIPVNTTACGSTCGTVVKALRVCNDTAVATCVTFKDGVTALNLPLCAAAQSCADFAHDAGTLNSGGASNWAGQQLLVSNAFTVLGSTPAAQGLGGITVQAFYAQPNK
jgi:hypothetical protein